jgi:hypothetical protein
MVQTANSTVKHPVHGTVLCCLIAHFVGFPALLYDFLNSLKSKTCEENKLYPVQFMHQYFKHIINQITSNVTVLAHLIT